jgi:PTS system nitrogen regulatory IIA component
MNSIADLLSVDRCLCQVPGGGKKRLFETIAEVLGTDDPGFHPGELVAGMLAREKLGTTALGGGIAIPHCRLKDCERPSGVLLTLSSAAEFEAPDGEAVDLVFALIVPSEATQEHLNILADLARLFSQAHFRDALRNCRSAEALYDTAVSWASRQAS